MELEGSKRGLDGLQNDGLNISVLATDRHSQIQKWIRETHPQLVHHFNVWHIAKGK